MTGATGQARLLPSDQRHNLLYVIFDGLVVGLMSAAASFASVYVIRLGASPVWVSLLSSLPSAIALTMAIPWSEFAERQSRPQRVFAFARLVVHTMYPLIAIVPFFLPDEWAARVTIIIWSLSAFPSTLSNMMFTLVMGHAVPPERRAFLMSRRWTFLGVAKLVALPLVSNLIERLPFPAGYQAAFAINALLAGAAFYCAWQLRVPSDEPGTAPGKGSLLAGIRSGALEIWSHQSFLIFVSGRALLNLGLALVAAVIPIYWIETLRASDIWVGYFNAALSGATLIAYFPWVRFKRKYGTRWTLIPSVIGTALYPALLSLARAPIAVLPVIAFNGIAGAGLNLAFFDALLEACPRDREARFVAINMTGINLVGVIGPPVGAALLRVLPIQIVLLAGTFVALAGAATFAFVRPRTRNSQRA